jgi:hypothetical protein
MKNIIFLLSFLLISSAIYSQNGSIQGKVSDRVSNVSLPFVSVVLQGATTGASTDLEGNYTLSGLNPGLYNVVFSSIGYKAKMVFEVEVSNSRVTYLNVQLEEMAVEVGEAEIVGSSFSNREEAPVSVRTIGVNEVKRNPGGNRDISRAIRSLPGVASVPSFRNDIIIRGGSPNENRFYIDGIEIPNINHFATQGASGGPVGLINVDFIENVEFYSGAFPANRGNALSSVLEFGFKEGRMDRYSANAVVGSSDVGLTVEGPTGENSSIIMSARRSYLQFLFEALRLPFLPTYNDFQFKWKTNLDDKNQITILGLGAIDQFELNTGLASDLEAEDYLDNKYLLDLLQINEQWNYSIGIKWDHFDEQGKWTYVASRNMLNNDAFKHESNDESLPLTFDYNSREMENKFRAERLTYKDGGWKINYGANYEYARYSNRSEFQQYSFTEDTVINIDYNTAFDLHKYGAFGQLSKKMLQERLVLSAGVRMDANNYSDDMSNPLDQLSPRFSASYYVSPRISLNFNTGIYYQLPAYTVLGYAEEGSLVNKTNGVRYIRNKQLVAGIQYDLNERNSLITVEGFWKQYDQYPLSKNKQIALANLGADFGVVGNEEVLSTAEGRAYGLEFLYQQKLFKGFYGILAYTYLRSEFTDGSGTYIPSAWDSRHLVSFTGGKKFKKNWEVGGRFLLSGGLPYTPYDLYASLAISTWNVARSGLPDYSRLNSERIDAFHQLDIRVDKKWFFENWNLNLFLDIQNVYNRETPLQPILDVQRDEAGNPIEDPANPGSYVPRFVNSSNGRILPSIGIIVEL